MAKRTSDKPPKPANQGTSGTAYVQPPTLSRHPAATAPAASGNCCASISPPGVQGDGTSIRKPKAN